MRNAEDSEKQATDLEEQTKLKLEEVEKQRLDGETLLTQCLDREKVVTDELQNLKVNKLWEYLWERFQSKRLIHSSIEWQIQPYTIIIFFS